MFFLLHPFLTSFFLWTIPEEEKGKKKDSFGSFGPKAPQGVTDPERQPGRINYLKNQLKFI